MDNTWGSPLVTLSAPNEVTLEATAAANQIAVLTPGARIELQAGSGPASLTQVLSFRIPVYIPEKQQLLGFVQDVILGITKSNGARVLVVADLAGTVKTFEMGFAESTATPINQALHIERFFSLQGLEIASAGVLGIEGPVHEYEATLVITVQRRNLEQSAIVSIDNLDIAAYFK